MTSNAFPDGRHGDAAAAATSMTPLSPERKKALAAWKTYYPYPRMGLIEALRQVQEWRLCVPAEDEIYLADLFETTVAHVHEVATFFPFFTQKATGRTRVGLCRGLSCSLGGSEARRESLCSRFKIKPGETSADGKFSLEDMECLGACEQAPALLINERLSGPATEASIAALVQEKPLPAAPQVHVGGGSTRILTRHFDNPRLHELEIYRSLGGYQGLAKALALKPAEVTEEVKRSNLCGLGGAGFPTGIKWGTVPSAEKVPGPRFVVVNADESEPGCYKDRVLLQRDPHQLIEGLLIASYAVGSKDSFIFIRGEYKTQYEIVEKALDEARQAGLIGENILGKGFSCSIRLMRGAGAYISGLDTALLETMEGKKAWPRQPPPFPTASGLMGKPTVVNNVETLSMLASILVNGGDWFAKIGTTKSGGTVVFSISGHVEKPGIYEFPMGTPLKVILDAAGGVRGGKKLKAVIPGGASTPVLSASEIDVPMDFEGLRSKGSFLGAGGIIVLDETTDMARVAHNIERFLAEESCGQCTPCREGSLWTERILERMLEGHGDAQDVPNLQRIGENITGKVICALGDTVGAVTRAFMKKFPADFSGKVRQTQSA